MLSCSEKAVNAKMSVSPKAVNALGSLHATPQAKDLSPALISGVQTLPPASVEFWEGRKGRLGAGPVAKGEEIEGEGGASLLTGSQPGVLGWGP